MFEYFKSLKTQPLKASDFVTDTRIPDSLLKNRVFLNEHYSPAAGKRNALSLKLRQQKIIRKYKLINATRPVALVTFPDGTSREYDAKGCTELLKNDPLA